MEKFDAIDPRWIYFVMALSLIVPVLKPIGLAITIDEVTTIPVYNWIESLQPGDIVVGDIAFSGGSEGELGPAPSLVQALHDERRKSNHGCSVEYRRKARIYTA